MKTVISSLNSIYTCAFYLICHLQRKTIFGYVCSLELADYQLSTFHRHHVSQFAVLCRCALHAGTKKRKKFILLSFSYVLLTPCIRWRCELNC